MTKETTDLALTAVTHDGAFRVIVLRASETAQAVVESQKIEGNNATHLAELVTATILVRLTMAPNYRVQGILRGAEGGTLVGDSHPDGMTRGLVQRPRGIEEVEVRKGALMQMMRTLPAGKVSQGVVEVPGESISEAVMGYFQSSEQITSVALVGTHKDAEGVRHAGAYIVQLLPEVSRDPLAAMVERLQHHFSDGKKVVQSLCENPSAMLAAILEDMPFAQTQETTVHFGCNCSSVRVLASLSSLPKSDLQELIDANEPIEMTCDYCGHRYDLSPSALAGLLKSS